MWGAVRKEEERLGLVSALGTVEAELLGTLRITPAASDPTLTPHEKEVGQSRAKTSPAPAFVTHGQVEEQIPVLVRHQVKTPA